MHLILATYLFVPFYIFLRLQSKMKVKIPTRSIFANFGLFFISLWVKWV